MPFADIFSIFQWWALLTCIGILFLPTTVFIFSHFVDKGYIFAKIIGILFISYSVFVIGSLKIFPFEITTILSICVLFLIVNILLLIRTPYALQLNRIPWKLFFFEEFLFLVGLFFWSYIRAHQPDIQGLEKFMDFGFVNAIIRGDYFPPKDMWFTPLSINYYYFGHLVTAVLTKLSGLASSTTYNLMLSTLFAFTFTCTFSIAANLFYKVGTKLYAKRYTLITGLLASFIASLGGNLHTLYSFFKTYENENPVPLWQLTFSPNTFPNGYWYPNATRFIYNTIHEFPLYSFVVSDLHGHVLDIPIVLLAIAVLLSMAFKSKLEIENWKLKILLISFLLAVMYMTNAWDGIIYALLTFLVFCCLAHQSKNYALYAKRYFLILIGFVLFSLPFSLHFKPFVSGIGVLCAPTFLTNIGKLGPFLFETNHCQHSPWWQLLILYGFFYFWVISFVVFLFRGVILKSKRLKDLGLKKILRFAQDDINNSDVFVILLILLSTILIIIPEFIYAKDIYPAHFRANTMFKLAYESFIMLSIASGYIIIRILRHWRTTNEKWKIPVITIGSIGLFLIFLYPTFAISSYYGDLKTYHGLDGQGFIKRLYPTDYQAILWINKNVTGQPVILEAQGDSYTDYGRVSVNTGLPTVLGWTVHEWLWRGTYDIPSPRIAEVETLYNSNDIQKTKQLIIKYNISLVFIGDLERQKYTNLNENKFTQLGKIVYQNGQTKIYQIR